MTHTTIRKTLHLLLMLVASANLNRQAHAQTTPVWKGVDFEITNGSERISNGTYTVSGSGSGFFDWQHDRGHYTYRSFPGGDFRFTARLASITGGKGMTVGLQVRQSTEPRATHASLFYLPFNSNRPDAPHDFRVSSRNGEPDAFNGGGEATGASPMTVPLWMQIVRSGNNFAVYRSTDGADWSMISNISGGALYAKGPLLAGFFVASGNTEPASATFDHVTIETGADFKLPWKTSWLGNTLGQLSTGHVAGLTNALYVAPDGTCYANAAFEEAAQTGKIYKDGKLIGNFGWAGNDGVHEGSITGDAGHIYYHGRSANATTGLIQANLKVDARSFKPLFTVNSFLDKNGAPKISGMALGNGDLYVSNPVTNQVMVLNPNVPKSSDIGESINNVTTQTIDTAGVENPAPQAVYQTQRTGYLNYSFPGFTRDTDYTVRLHFAEIVPANDAVGKHVIPVGVGPFSDNAFDIVAKAGKPYKAYVETIKNVRCNNEGLIYVMSTYSNVGARDNKGAINGIEILKPDGTAALRLNCGGADVPGTDWKGEAAELPARTFPFTRPGPIAVDKRGNLWIVQEGREYPASGEFSYTPGWAAIKCYDKNGKYLGKEMTDLANPTAIAYDAAKDRLLVAENGPDQNIRIYTGLEDDPKCTSTFGSKGGVFSGKTPGLIFDPEAGGWTRFYGPTGVGVDAAGNIYVACNMGPLHTDIRSFKPDGTLNWKLQGLEFCNIGDFDASVDSSDMWTTDKHYKMDWRATTPGGEWSLYSVLRNPFAKAQYSFSYHNSCAIYRRFGPDKTPFVFAGGQGFLGNIEIRRFEGEQLVPCGLIYDNKGVMWLDSNGDGIDQPDSEELPLNGPGGSGIACFDVAENGDIYLGSEKDKTIRKLTFTGISDKGVPKYSGITGNASTFQLPSTFGKIWWRPRIRHQLGTDSMYIMGYGGNKADNITPDTKLLRYNNWSTKPTLAYMADMPTPLDNSNYIGAVPSLYPQDGYIYMAFDVANDKVFACELSGPIHVMDANTGKQVFKIFPGPEVSGTAAWQDNGMGIRAHYNKATGSYYINTENSGWAAKLNLYRWKP